VYKGQDPATGDVVAVKLLASELVNNEWRMRFAQECQVTRALHHPHIVRVLDFGLDGSKAYLVMEYVDGVSLGQRLEETGPLPEDEAVTLIRQVGQALHWAHERKLVHRDIKPDNILVDAAGHAKLADLGLAKNLEANLSLTGTNCALGTPKFMAPEQFVDAKRADALSDLYSLAATLYVLVTGHLPFDTRGGPVEIYKKKKANDLVAPRKLVPGLNERVNRAILRGLRAERGERPASVLEFLDLLVEVPATALPARASHTGPAPGPAVRSAGGLPHQPRPAAMGDEVSALFAGKRRLAGDGTGWGVAGTVPFLLRFVARCALVLAPPACGVLCADRFFSHSIEQAFLSMFAGWALAGLLVWWFIRRGLTGRPEMPRPSGDEGR
jgi:hypothetical protein